MTATIEVDRAATSRCAFDVAELTRAVMDDWSRKRTMSKV